MFYFEFDRFLVVPLEDWFVEEWVGSRNVRMCIVCRPRPCSITGGRFVHGLYMNCNGIPDCKGLHRLIDRPEQFARLLQVCVCWSVEERK